MRSLLHFATVSVFFGLTRPCAPTHPGTVPGLQRLTTTTTTTTTTTSECFLLWVSLFVKSSNWVSVKQAIMKLNTCLAEGFQPFHNHFSKLISSKISWISYLWAYSRNILHWKCIINVLIIYINVFMTVPTCCRSDFVSSDRSMFVPMLTTCPHEANFFCAWAFFGEIDIVQFVDFLTWITMRGWPYWTNNWYISARSPTLAWQRQWLSSMGAKWSRGDWMERIVLLYWRVMEWRWVNIFQNPFNI